MYPISFPQLPPLRDELPSAMPQLPCLLPPVNTLIRRPPRYPHIPTSSRRPSEQAPQESEWWPPQHSYFTVVVQNPENHPCATYNLASGTTQAQTYIESSTQHATACKTDDNRAGLNENSSCETSSVVPAVEESDETSSKSESSKASIRSKPIKKRARAGSKAKKRSYMCPYSGCNKILSERSNLKAHMRIHTRERPYRCKIKGCSKTFIWKSSLTYHINVVHGDQRPFSCPYCKKRFAERPKLKIHVDWCLSSRRQC